MKEFVKYQTTPVKIGVPKRQDVQQQADAVSPAVASEEVAEVAERKKAGRPRNLENEIRMCLYLTEDMKRRIQFVQHKTFKQSMKEVIHEALEDIFAKYGV